MGKTFPEIDAKLADWLHAQRMFFVATAPSGDGGHVNCSPKGAETFRVLGPKSVAYLDLTGSGVETIAHLEENGRIVLMFCAFDGPPKIVRLHGVGRVVRVDDAEFDELRAHFDETLTGDRAIVVVDVTRVGDSCGYGVPLYTFEGERDVLRKWADKKGEAGVRAYWEEKNARSIDGLPGV